jgi:transcriptional regulator with XRE-family HTH domain
MRNVANGEQKRLARLFAMCERWGMETLASYLAASGTSQRAFAEAVGASPSFINEIVRGLKKPGRGLAVRIAKVTQGKIPADAWDEGLTQ